MAAGWSIILYCSCISLKIAPLSPAEHLLEKIEFCPSVVKAQDTLKPVGPKDEFSVADGQVCCLIMVKIVQKTLTLQWKWYSPEKTLWKDTGNIAVEYKGQAGDIIFAYDQIGIEGEGLVKGTWTVAIFLNGDLAGRRAFIAK